MCKQHQRQACNHPRWPIHEIQSLIYDFQLKCCYVGMKMWRNLSHRNSVLIRMHSHRCCIGKDRTFLRLEIWQVKVRLSFTWHSHGKRLCSVFETKQLWIRKRGFRSSLIRIPLAHLVANHGHNSSMYEIFAEVGGWEIVFMQIQSLPFLVAFLFGLSLFWPFF